MVFRAVHLRSGYESVIPQFMHDTAVRRDRVLVGDVCFLVMDYGDHDAILGVASDAVARLEIRHGLQLRLVRRCPRCRFVRFLGGIAVKMIARSAACPTAFSKSRCLSDQRLSRLDGASSSHSWAPGWQRSFDWRGIFGSGRGWRMDVSHSPSFIPDGADS